MTAGQVDRPRDEGMSLVELLIAMGLFMVLTTALTAIAILGMRISSGLQVRLDNATQSELGLAASSKVLRTAVRPGQLGGQVCSDCGNTAIVTATKSKVTFFANLNNTGQGPSLTSLEVVQDPYGASSSAVLRQTTQAPVALPDGRYSYCAPGAAGCVVNTRTLARGLAYPVATVFTYFDFDGVAIASTSLSSSDLARVSSVDVMVTVQTRPGQTAYPANTAVQRVRLPNALQREQP